MHVSRAGGLFFIFGEGVWKWGRKEMKSCERVSANHLPGPFFDYKKIFAQVPMEAELVGAWVAGPPAGEEAVRASAVLGIITVTNSIATIIVTHIC